MLAYFDCFCGISGDMTLGALIDLGVPLKWLQKELSRLPLKGFYLTAKPVIRNGMTANQVTVAVENPGPPRDFKKIRSLIENCALSDPVKSRSMDIFAKLARAEARIHGCPVEEVHFHEVGAIDAIVDIVGTALCLEKLGIEKVVASRIPMGTGFVESQHGRLPVPAPATLEILKNVPVYGTEIAHELVTPTGAAIIASVAESFGPLPPMHIEKAGYGAGQRELKDRPNLLRIVKGIPVDPKSDLSDRLRTDEILILETCIDDMNPEFFGFIMERLFADGAIDVYWIPIHMKKNRPGTLVQILCDETCKARLIERLLTETTSLGVRYHKAGRRLLHREQYTVRTSLGEIRVKRVTDLDGGVRLVPEYEACRKIALQRKLPLRVVYDTVAKEAAETQKR
jgi:pyridinium-3,5-bisthiocarboxylic acid mononucleotide nickel chelatase